MSKFTSTNRINTRWRGNDFVGAPGSSHTFPNELHDEFLVDWAYKIQIGDITITETPTTGNIQVSTLTVGDLVLTGTATGNFGAGSTVVQGTAPISISTTSNTSTVSLNANYSTSTHTHTSFANNLQINKADSKVQLLNTTSGSGTEDGMYLLMADTDVGYLWNAETNGALVLGTGGAERARITPAGKFGIGTNTPAHQLEVVGPQSVTVGVSAGGAGFAELELVGQAGKNYITSDDTLSFDIGGAERATVATTGLDVTSGTLSQGGTAVSLSTHTHAYQPAGTYVTAVNGTAPITASTTTAGAATVGVSTGTTSATVALGNHLHTGVYDPAGTAASAVATHEADTTSVHGITDTANLLTTSTTFTNIANASTTATTISSTTSSAPTDISGMTFTFTPTYDEDVFVQANLLFTQTVAPTATVDIISRFIINGTIVSPQGGFLRLTSGNSSPTGFTNSMAHTFTVASGVATTVKVAAYRSIANGTFGTSNISTFSILRVRA